MTDTTYTIQMASKISGVGVHTIRAWEKRYKALVPQRDASGHRTYTKSDVEKLMLLSELCLLGYAISKVAALSTPELKEQLKNLGKTEESLENQDFNLIHDTKPVIDPGQSLPILNFAFRTYNLDVINVELAKLKAMLPANEFALKVVGPLYETLNDIVKSGAYQPHQEAAVKSLLKFHMSFDLYHPVGKKEKGSVNAIIMGDGDASDFLLGPIGLLCRHYGFYYTYLGPNVPVESVLDIVKSFEANLIILGALGGESVKSHFQSVVEKISTKTNEQINMAVVSNFEADKLPSKRLTYLKDLGAIDRFLDNYLSKS